jgi:Protein of unknown function (DUF2721)
MQGNQTPLSGLGVISALVAPALLILSVASLVGSTLSRIARIGDRARKTIAELDVFRSTHNAEGIRFCRSLLSVYRRRSRLAELALSAYYLSVGLLVAGSLAIALDHFLRGPLPWLASTITMAGALLLLLGTLLLFLETRMAAGALRNEIDFSERDGEGQNEPG